MEQQENYSMTPPDSPIFRALQLLQDDDEEMVIPERALEFDPSSAVPVTFCCQGEVDLPTNTHPDGCLRRGAIDRIQKCSKKHQETRSPTIELFDFTFDRASALQKNRDTLFNLLRQNVNQLEKASTVSSLIQLDGTGSEYLKIRQDCRAMFDYLQEFIQGNHSARSVVPDLVNELQDLLVFVARLHDLPRTVLGHAASKHGNKSGSGAHHMFHLVLELHWSVLETLQILAILYPEHLSSTASRLCVHRPGNDFGEAFDPVGEVIHLLLWDIVLIALSIYNRLAPSMQTTSSPFPCTCVQELSVLMIHLLQYRQQKYAKQSFWVALTSVLQDITKPVHAPDSSTEPMEIDSNVYLVPFEVKCEDVVGFSWWFLLHLSPLYSYDQYGSYTTASNPLPNNYYLAQELMKKSLTTNEASLRVHLRCCLTVLAQWEPSNRLVNILWEHFYKKLNEHFKTQTSGLMGHVCIHKTAVLLYENCRRIAENDLQGLNQDTSFQLFLRLLSQYLQGSAQPLQSWKQIKGRFYSKFHAGRVQELTDTGVQNLALLFVVLAHLADTEDVSSKLCELLVMVTSAPSVHPSRRLAVWKSLFALMMLHVRKGISIGFLADKIAPEFDKLASGLADTRDGTAYSTLWPLIALYADSTQDVLEYSSTLGLQEHKLIGKGFATLLPKCRENDLKHLLNFIQAVLNRYRQVQTEQREQQHAGTWCANPAAANSLKALVDRLWQVVYGFIKQHATTLTPPLQLADVAATFTLLTLEVSPGVQVGGRDDFLKCFTYFTNGPSVNSLITCRYLCQVLSNTGVMERLQHEVKGYEAELIQAWFRCHWHLLPKSDHLQDLTRSIMELATVKELMTNTGDSEQSPEGFMACFLVAMGTKYKDILDLRTKMEFRAQVDAYFGDVGKHISQVLKNCGSSDLVKNVYHLGGLMVKNCASVLYISMKPNCLLPVLLDKLILPRSFAVQNKDLPPNVMSAIREHLHWYVSGFSSLDYQGDPYLQRKLKEMVNLYFLRFPINSSHTMSGVHIHPFVAAICEDDTPFRQHALRVVMSEFLTGKGNAANTTLQVIQFILEVVRKSKNSKLIASDCPILLSPMLTQFMENAHYRTPLTHIVSTLLESSKKHQHVMPKEELQRIVSTVISCCLPVHQSRVFRTLENIVQCNVGLFVDLIPMMTGAVKMSEMKRGLGVDKQLRLAYCNLLNQLGPSGRDEKSKLLTDSRL